MAAAVDWWDRFWAKVDTSAGPDACWPWTGACSQAAGRKRREWTGNTRRPRFALITAVSGKRKSTLVYAARLMLSLFDGVPLDARAGLYACHKPICPNPICVNPRHLYWGTHEENVADRYPLREP